MKRVCIVDYDFSVCGGVERVTAVLANALAEHYEVYLLSICMGGDEKAFWLDERVKYTVILDKVDRLRYQRKKLKPQIGEFFVKNCIDIAILQGNYTGFLVSTTVKKGHTKLVFVDHGALMNQWSQKDIRLIRWLAAKRCEATAVLTEQSAQAYRKKFHLKSPRVRCIYNWVEPELGKSKGYDAQSKRIISAGRFGPEKGFERLIEVFARVVKKHPDWQLDIFGDGERKEAVEALIKKNGLEENVQLPGMVNDLGKRYGDYAMYVLPSDREGMPLVLLEAKANLLPIVSFDIMTGPAEIINDGVDGILIQPYDIDKMAEAVCGLIEDKELRQSMSDHSQDNMEKFSKAAILKQWMKLIEELTN